MTNTTTTDAKTAAQAFLKELTTLAPSLDDDVRDYIKGFLRESQSVADVGRDGESLIEFVEPLLSAGDDFPSERLSLVCRTYAHALFGGDASNASGAADDNAPRAVDKPVYLQDVAMVSAAAEFTVPQHTGDLSLHVSKRRPPLTASHVDKKKLEKIEARLLKKQLERSEDVKVFDPFIDVGARSSHQALASVDPLLGAGKSKDIRIENFDIHFGGKVILSCANLFLVGGRRYGLIGRNGVGKSTLLRNFARRQIKGVNKDGVVPEWMRILHVEQEIESDDTSVLQSVLNGDPYLTSLREHERHLSEQLKHDDPSINKDEISQDLKQVWNRLEVIEADKAESRAAVILNGLGFTAVDQQAATRTFSGGWRMRVSLAIALFCKPDILLLDEPTNHLDMKAVVWLEDYLQSWENTVVIVSHDRDFLDSVATDIIHMHNNRLDYYKGNYSVFMGTRSERRKNQLREYEAQQQFRAHLQDFIDRWRFNAKRAAQAQAKIKVLEKLPVLEPPIDDGIDDGQLNIQWPDPVDKLSPPILSASDVSFGYTPDRPILKNVSFSLSTDSRIGIVGKNGAGKSTLLKLLIGEVEPSAGLIQRHGRLRVAYFSQHHVDALESDTASPVHFLATKFPGTDIQAVRSLLGRFGITGNTALQSIRSLSGGQKSRVVFAYMAIQNPHVLICDEISNHLDIMTIDSLVQALKLFKGSVLIVSHDARFIDQCCDEMWVCEDGTMNKFLANDPSKSGIMEYKKRVIDEYRQDQK